MNPFLRVLIALLLTLPVIAEVRLPHVFTQGAVFQRDRPVPVWGRADKGEKVTVTFAGQSHSTKADDKGRWMVRLDPMPANANGQELAVTQEGATTVKVDDVLVGEVWLASGQSNMEWPVSRCRQEDQEIANSGPVKNLRILQVPNKLSPHPLEDIDAHWQRAEPKSVKEFSAVAYFFGRDLSEHLKVPIGIISAEWGGSRIEPWINEAGYASVGETKDYFRYREPRIPGTDAYEKVAHRHLDATRAWVEEARKALRKHRTLPAQPPAPPTLNVSHNGELGLYQAMIHPLTPFALRGFIWYQGESNRDDGMQYRWKMEALIKGWRKVFESKDAPFLYVQLAPFKYKDREPLLPRLWVAQTEALDIPNTGMAIINDIGNPRDIHPNNKSEVGRRLALLARADTYGERDLVKTGPLFRRFEIKDGKVIIKFDHTGKGLKTSDGKSAESFEIAGDDNRFERAKAEIHGDRVILHSDKVPSPTRARFAWSETAAPKLVNSAGLPASAFHTHWPDDPELGRNLALGKPFISSDPNKGRWNSGLTDGHWDGETGRCFATGDSPNFPKHVTIDLKDTKKIHAVRLGAPSFGSTKLIAVSVSAGGKEFEEVGRYEFKARSEDKATLLFDERPARHVRITFLEQHPQQDNYSDRYGFLREVEVFKRKED